MKNAELIAQMNWHQKAAFLGGKNEWESMDFPKLGIPTMVMSDGPHGLRRQGETGDHLGLGGSKPATCFPTAATMANSWDPDLGEEVGRALGEEAQAMGVQVLLGPGLNIKRSPLCGRNFEYFSEDPYQSGKMAAAYSRGIQSQGVYSCLKHFAVNSQESKRMAMNAVIDERTLREIYLTGFEMGIKEGGAKAIMSSYNEVNGVYANENPHLLKEILRDDWGFDGIVITDWGASNDHAAGTAAGSNLEMPSAGFDSAREIIKAVSHGTLSEDDVNARVDELLTAVLETNSMAKGVAEEGTGFDIEAHHQIARKAAAESMVLLKNEENILPLAPGTKVAVIGDFAKDPRYQGSGSSKVNSTKVDTIENVIGNYDLDCIGIAGGYSRDGKVDYELAAEAVRIAAKADVVLFFFGLTDISESEGLDREHMRIPVNQIDLLDKLYKVNRNIVGVISAGSSIEMPWENQLCAILHAYLTGQAGASAMLDVLTGAVNPSGHLSETYPVKFEDNPVMNYYPAKERITLYKESLFEGYRYYNTAGIPVRYPFGYGLSYTSFQISRLAVEEDGVCFTITNTGSRDGAEVVQMYVGKLDPKIFRAKKELKGFKKVFLKAGESRDVKIPFDDYTFRYWNVRTEKWEVEGGEYEIMIGTNVEATCVAGTVMKEDTTNVLPYAAELLPSYMSGKICDVSDQEYDRILEGSVPHDKVTRKLDINDAMCDLKKSYNPISLLHWFILDRLIKDGEKKGVPNLNVLFQYNMPFRALAKMTGGLIGMDTVKGLVRFANLGVISGLVMMIFGLIKNFVLNAVYKMKL